MIAGASAYVELLHFPWQYFIRWLQITHAYSHFIALGLTSKKVTVIQNKQVTL